MEVGVEKICDELTYSSKQQQEVDAVMVQKPILRRKRLVQLVRVVQEKYSLQI